MIKNKKYFITGASGFVGANLAIRLVNLDQDVHVLIRKESDLWRLNKIKHKLTLHYGDIRKNEIIENIIKTIDPNIVYHLAVYGAYSEQNNPNKILDNNIIGSLNLFQSCRSTNNLEMIVNTGSSSEYGFKSSPMKEVDILEPNSYYAVAKASQTMLMNYIAERYKLPAVSLRLFSVYGQWEEKTRLIPTLINSCLKDKNLNLVSPDVVRDFIYIEDVIDVYLKIIDFPQLSGEIFNVGTGKESTIKEVVDIVLKNISTKSKPLWGSMVKREWDSLSWVADTKKIKKFLDWKPRFTLENGLKESILWFNKNNRYY